MTDDAPDNEALAKRFLDLWQDQVAASVGDPAMAEWLARFLAAPGAPGAPGTPGASGMTPTEGVSQHGAFADIFTAMAAGATPAAASSGAGDDRLDELLGRLGGIEERLAALESGPGKPGGKPRKRPRKRTP